LHIDRMNDRAMLQQLEQHLKRCSTIRWNGRVTRVTGNLIESEGPFGSVGDACEIRASSGARFAGEIVGFRGRTVLSMMTEDPTGIRLGDVVTSLGCRPSVAVGADMLGQVLDANGQALDGVGKYRSTRMVEIDRPAPNALERLPIREPLGCGIRALDAFTTCGRGQRLGIFGGSGVGKSTLLGMMCRGAAADVIVMALVGERGREVGEFLEVIGEEGRKRSVIIVSTSNEPPLMRLRAALIATAIAEAFAAEGKHVLLVVDSLTRFAMAQREIGLAAGEPPTAKGYTPSVLNKLARLVERAGRFRQGSITAFYTVLMEGDDQQDPVVDTVRSLLDGHIILDRRLATKGHYPPIDILDSLSRLMPSIVGPEHMKKATGLRRLLAAYARSEDLIRIGAYQRGSDAVLDRAVEVLPQVEEFLRQSTSSLCPFEETGQLLSALPS
jgi:flagellum-specific ATP synthase